MMTTSILTNSPDEIAAIDAINAIYAYVEAQRIKIPKFPAIGPLIDSFEGWYGQLEESTKGGMFPGMPGPSILVHTVNVTDVNEAKRRRQEINDAMGAKLPSDSVPADSGQTPADKPPVDSTISTIVTTVAVVIGGIVLYKLLT